ncbi:hypothetical protein ACQ4LE_003721 [Meloidogyne hapla]
MAGSDFDPEFFTASERGNFQTLLNRLRSFEKTVAHSFRQFEDRLGRIEENIKSNKNSITGTKGSVTKLRNSLKNFENVIKENLNVNVQAVLNEEENQIEDLEENNPNLGDPEVNTGDPFLSNGGFIPNYDGNPALSFSKWSEKFKDILSLLTTPLTEAQKLARLRFCLNGQARSVYDSIDPAPVTLEGAILVLKARFENGNTKIIARQALSICKQNPGEPVFDFSNRLNDAVRTALTGENEDTIQKRLLEEFLDRLVPDLQFQVKSHRPTNFGLAYEQAQHFELLLNARKPAVNISMSELAEKVDALVIAKNKPDIVICYNCRKQGHIARYCHDNPRNFNNGSGKNLNNHHPRANYGNRNYDNRQRPNYNGGYRNNQGYSNGYSTNRREENNTWNPPNRRSQQRNDNRNACNYRNSRVETYSRENSRSSERGSTPRVRFQRRSSTGVRVVSPLLFAFIALISVLCGASAQSPMLCLSNAPNSLWKFPDDPICPSWQPSESPIPLNLYVHRANTLEYKTPATVCKCVKSKISRRLTIFGSQIEEIVTENINVPISTCAKMRETNTSQAGKLLEKNGTLRATDNSLEVGWNIWPIGIAWSTNEVINCYVYETVVFTHFGVDSLNTPIGSCPECNYKSGTCKCSQGSLIWKPDKTQQCAFIPIAEWRGEYASRIWISEFNEFALTFENITKKIDCGQKEMIITDQGYAISNEEFKMVVNLMNKSNHYRKKREAALINKLIKTDIDNLSGIVYTPQLESQLTALSTKVTRTTQKLFAESVRQICNTLQSVADQTLALAAASPTLLARYFLKLNYITARLLTEKTLEIRPCYPIQDQEIHFNWKQGFCFDRLPVSFNLHEQEKHGFLDTKTLIIHSSAGESDCEINKLMYVTLGSRTIAYDQMTGDQKEISEDGIRKIARFGKIDLPEMGITIFKNKILTNLTEIYSPEHFSETIETAAITHEITRLTSKGSLWQNPSARTEAFAANIVAKGLFAFLTGGIFSINQFWVFACCCYVTFQFLIQFVLPTILAQTIGYLNIGERIFQYASRKRRKTRENQFEDSELTDIKIHQFDKEKPLPISQRWPSQYFDEEKEKDSKNKVAEVKIAAGFQCDENMRILVEINGMKLVCLLDTGAHITLIGQKTAKRLGVVDLYQPDFSGIVGIGHNIIPALGQAKICLKIANFEINTKVIVVKDEVNKNGSYSGIIGRETLKILPFALNFRTGELIKLCKAEVNSQEKVCISSRMQGIISKSGLNDPQEKDIFKNFILKNEENFARDEFDLGKCKITAPTILTNTDNPIQSRVYRTPEKYRTELKAQIQKMLENGIIEESNTPWVSNLVLVQKSNGKLRPCVDFRPLNKVTIADPYPLPRMDEVINKVAGKAWYSILDLASGFWQIPLDRESAYKCGIITEWGLYEMKRLPFGLKNAPSIFQRTMDKILKGINNVTAYIDDILIHTNDFESHIKTLEIVIKRLNQNGLKLKGEKCEFFKNKCTYLGFELNKNGYQPAQSNCEIIIQFPEPKDVKEVKRFLGMASFFRKFIPNFAELANPLNKLTRGRIPNFSWSENERKVFNELKDKLTQAPCLQPPNYEKSFHLFCDASNIAYGAALMQSNDNVNLHAVCYWSRTLTEPERQLPATHGELAAIYNAVTHFRAIIYGSKLIIYTDHRPITYLFAKASTNTKLNRWLMALQEIEPEVVYLEGTANKIADALSRISISWNSIKETMPKEDMPYLMSAISEKINREMVEIETEKDINLMKIYKAIKENWYNFEENEETLPYFQIRDKLFIDGKLIKKGPESQIIIPEKLKITVLNLIHNGHFGIVRCKNKARKHIWWPNINRDIEDFIKLCQVCQKFSPEEPQLSKHYHWPESKTCFERIHIDLAGPFVGKNFLVIIDSYSRFPWVFQVKNTNSAAIIKKIRGIFTTFGPPNTLVSDNGRQFVSFEFDSFLEDFGIRHLKSPPYHPPSNGLCERFIQTFKNGVKKMLDCSISLEIAQETVLLEYRASPHPTLGESPAKLFLKREIRTPIDLVKIPTSKINPLSNELEEKKLNFSPKQKIFEIDEQVWVRLYGEKAKWEAAMIRERSGENVYKVEFEDGSERVAHSDQLRARKSGLRNSPSF